MGANLAIVALYRGRSRLFNRFLSSWLASPYSHCELVESFIGDAMMCWSSSIEDGGVRRKAIQFSGNWELWVVPGDAEKALEWFRLHNGKGYDFLGLFGFVIRWIKGDKRRYFCSEAVMASLGFEDPFRFSPADVASIAKRVGQRVQIKVD